MPARTTWEKRDRVETGKGHMHRDQVEAFAARGSFVVVKGGQLYASI